MDRNFYHQKLANAHQLEISKALANQHMLKDLKREPLTGKQAKRLVLRIAPAVIVMAILVVSFLI